MEEKGNVIGAEFDNSSTKTTESYRDIVFERDVELVIRNAFVLQQKQKNDNQLYLNESNLLFTTASGKPIELRNLTRFWKRLCIRLDIPYRSPHKSRHIFISRMDALV